MRMRRFAPRSDQADFADWPGGCRPDVQPHQKALIHIIHRHIRLHRLRLLERISCRLWFVRMPKPLEETASVASEHELESFKTQVAILNESLNVKRVRQAWDFLAHSG